MANATTPIWVPLIAPVIAALATWATTKFELMSLRRLKQFEGTWYAYYRDPSSHEHQEEIWDFSSFGAVTVSRNGRKTFKGRLTLKGRKAFMNVDSTLTRDERLVVMLNAPLNPRGDPVPSVCIWLGQDDDQKTTAGHGVLSRSKLDNPPVKDEFLRAEASRPFKV